MSHAMKKVSTPLSAPVKKAIEAFEAYAEKHAKEWSTCDTEAGWNLHNIIRRAVAGMPFPDRVNFEVYYMGWEDEPAKSRRAQQINQAMTNKARRVYNAIVNGPMSNRDALKSYAWRVDFLN